jgi:hypothetical protein
MAAVNSLTGRSVLIRANDFVDAPTRGRIRFIDMTTNAVAIELDTPLEAGGIRYEWAVASPRLARDNLDTLINTGVLGCGISWVPNSRFSPSAPFDLSWWRGGAAALADLAL